MALVLSVVNFSAVADSNDDDRGTFLNEDQTPIADPKATPGDVLTTSAAKVCVRGYSATVRNVSTSTKNQIYASYGITHHVSYQYEIDHDISLELGGSNSVKNLWPEPNDKARGNSKDVLENKLRSLVCKGTISLKTAQQAIKGDWTKAYAKYIGKLAKYRAYQHTGSSSSSGGTTGGTTSTPSGGTDPQYSTCAEAKSHGYGPYRSGTDPEYAWYRDADHDGVVCE